jgi:Na+-translocating ferredoxin:NAD+ oxidoreductase RnfD subunit
MYAILIMNALVPFINRATQPRVFGTGLREAKSP